VIKMVCEECGRGLRYNTESGLCSMCMNDLIDETLERFMQEEYKAEGEKVFKCPKCNRLDCIQGDFVLNDWEEFKPILKPTNTDMWCQYMYKGKMVQGNTLLDEIQELRMECKYCGYDFDGQDDELNNNTVITHGGV